MKKEQLVEAIRALGGTAYKSWKKVDLERIYNDMVAPASVDETPASVDETPAIVETPAPTPASVDETPAPTPTNVMLDTVKVPTITVTGITSVDAPTPAPIAYTPARITPARITPVDITPAPTPASQIVAPAPIAPTPASFITANARPLTPAITETSNSAENEDDNHTEYYTRLDGKECVTALDKDDLELFAFIRDAIQSKFGTNINIEDIPLVAKKDDSQNAQKVTLKHDRSAGRASANYVHITTFRKVKKVFDTSKKLKKAGEDNTSFETVQVIIATLTINNYGVIDSAYYFDPKEASQKDIAEYHFVLAPNADGEIIKAKINKNTGRMIQRVRKIDFILAHTVKREIDIHLEEQLRNNNYYGRFYTYFGTERLVD